MLTIYEFLKRKLRERNVRIDDIVNKSGLSRTTIYRMMKGLIMPTAEVQELLIKELSLSVEECDELDSKIQLINIDVEQLIARERLRELFFGLSEKNNCPQDDVELIVYSDAKYIMTVDEIFESIVSKTAEDGFFCDLKIINCVDGIFAPIIRRMITDIPPDSVVIEQLVTFYEINNSENATVLKAIIPMLGHGSYNLHFKSADNKSNETVFMQDVMLLKYGSIEDAGHFLVFSFEKNGLSDCVISDDRRIYDFFSRKYKLQKNSYLNSVSRVYDLEYYSETLSEYEVGGSYRLLLSPCYDQIPVTVFQSMFQELNNEQIRIMTDYFGLKTGVDIADMFKGLIESLDVRSKLSDHQDLIEVFTASGLESFARTGFLVDHFPFMPQFTKEQIRISLENIKNRHAQESNKYCMYIVNESYVLPMIALVVYDKGSFHIECAEKMGESDCVGISHYCHIEQQKLAQSLKDFILHYIPQRMAKSEKDAENFIDDLITRYC